MKTAREQLLERVIFAFQKECWRQLGSLKTSRGILNMAFLGAWGNQPHRPGVGEKAQLREGGKWFWVSMETGADRRGTKKMPRVAFFFLLLFLDWLSCLE